MNQPKAPLSQQGPQYPQIWLDNQLQMKWKKYVPINPFMRRKKQWKETNFTIHNTQDI